MIRAVSKVQIVKENRAPVALHQKHEKQFKSTGFSSLLSKKDFNVSVIAYRDTVHPLFINEFQVKIDNTKCSQEVKAVRMSLARTVVAGSTSLDQIKVADEEVKADTHSGGPAH